MTINVQATRPSVKETAPGHEEYREKDDRRRRFVPLIFLLIVGSCSAYLKSFLPVKLEASEDRGQPRGPGDEEQETAKEEVLAAGEEPDPEQPAAAGADGKDEEVAIALHGEAAAASGATDFSAQARTDKPKVETGSGESPKVANDNRPQPRQEAPPGGGGAGGGGGGGGGDDRHPRDPRDPPPPDHRNRAPRLSGAVHLPDVVACNGLAISLAALLAGASDPDGDTLAVVGIYSSSGTLTRTADGWEFDRAPDMLGEVKLTYAISDGSHIVMQTAYFNVVEAPPIIGTEGDDTLLGTQCAETIVGLGGDDNIDARGGNDRISGGDGDDHILAGAGHDVVYAGDGNDIVFAGAGNDVVFGGAGDDRLFGEDGDDTLQGEDGNDRLDGGAGRDILLAGDGNDTLDGGSGNDILADGGGSDAVAGGDGDDLVVASADAAGDSFDGGAGKDTLDYSSAAQAIDVNLATGKASGADIGHDAISEIETVIGGTGNDTLTAGPTAASLDGAGGDDVVTGGAGDDALTGGAGTDTLNYSAFVRKIDVNLATGRASGEDIGEDEIAEFEIVVGGAGDDAIAAGVAAATIAGGCGDDALTGGAGDDVLAGGTGNDTIADGGGSDRVDGGCGDDVVLASADGTDDSFDGGAGKDTLDYSSTTITVTIDLRNGTAKGLEIGKDLIQGFEEIIAGLGDDVIHAGGGSVVLTGGAGNDCFTFQCDDGGGSQQDVVKKITDFTVGDKIVAATYQITIKDGEDAEEQVADLFGQIYLEEDNGGHGRPVRFRFEELADRQYTAIDVAHGTDAADVMTIEVDGHHHLQYAAIHS